MTTQKILLTLMLGMVLLLTMVSFASAKEYTGRQYADVIITDNCVVNGFPCPADFLCNITISDPDLNLIILNEPMTRNDTVYNYTYSTPGLLGDYKITINCDNTTLAGTENSILTVTTTGRSPNLVIPLLLILSSLGIFILALYLKNHAIGFISGSLFIISGVYLMVYGLGDLLDMYTRSIAYVIIAFGLFIILIAGYEWLDDLED